MSFARNSYAQAQPRKSSKRMFHGGIGLGCQMLWRIWATYHWWNDDPRWRSAISRVTLSVLLNSELEWEFVQGLSYASQTPQDAEFVQLIYTCRLRKYKHAAEHALARQRLVEEFGLGDNPDVLYSFADALYANFRWADCFVITTRYVLGLTVSLLSQFHRFVPEFLGWYQYIMPRCLYTLLACTISSTSTLNSLSWRMTWLIANQKTRSAGMQSGFGTWAEGNGRKRGNTSGRERYLYLKLKIYWLFIVKHLWWILVLALLGSLSRIHSH